MPAQARHARAATPRLSSRTTEPLITYSNRLLRKCSPHLTRAIPGARPAGRLRRSRAFQRAQSGVVEEWICEDEARTGRLIRPFLSSRIMQGPDVAAVRKSGMDSENRIVEVSFTDDGFAPPREALLAAVEEGRVLCFPAFPFALQTDELRLLDPAIADPKRKNISLDPASGVLHGVLGDAATQAAVRGLIARYFAAARDLVDRLFPEYRGALRAAPTSLRLQRVETRETSWRKDDSRLHVDAFPSRPNHGERILRVFLNVNPNG